MNQAHPSHDVTHVIARSAVGSAFDVLQAYGGSLWMLRKQLQWVSDPWQNGLPQLGHTLPVPSVPAAGVARARSSRAES